MTYFGPKLMPLEISRCNVPGVRVMRGMGERNAIGTTTEGEDLWLGNDLSNTPAALASTTFIPSPADAGEQMSVISEHANDASGNTGVQTLSVSYIDAAGAEQTTIVTMNGTTAVPLTPTDVRFVQEMGALTVGSNTVAEGNIRIYKTSDATLVYNMIAIGGNQSLVPHRMVPAGKTLHIMHWNASEVRGKRMFIRLRSDCTTEWPPVRQQNVFLFKDTLGCNLSTDDHDVYVAVPEFSVIKVSAFAVATLGEASCSWWGYLVDN